MSVPTALQSVVNWLRAGYPEGVPERDHQPLLALLRRRLTVDEVRTIGEQLRESGDPATADAIAAAIADVTRCEPSEEDISRVRSHLAAGGWPLSVVE